MPEPSISLERVTRFLSRNLLRVGHSRIMMDYFRSGLPKISLPTDRKEWNRRVARIRQGLVANVFLRGHAPGILAAPPKVEWRGVLETGKGYRIRKLRYDRVSWDVDSSSSL